MGTWRQAPHPSHSPSLHSCALQDLEWDAVSLVSKAVAISPSMAPREHTVLIILLYRCSLTGQGDELRKGQQLEGREE